MSEKIYKTLSEAIQFEIIPALNPFTRDYYITGIANEVIEYVQGGYRCKVTAQEFYEIAKRYDKTLKVQYVVNVGWVKPAGTNIFENYIGDTDEYVYNTFDDAMATYDQENIAQMWRTEKMCAGRAFDFRDAYKSISSWIADDESICEFIETIKEERYGITQENQEQ